MSIDTLKRWRHDFSHGSLSNDGFWTPYQEAADRIAELEKERDDFEAALKGTADRESRLAKRVASSEAELDALRQENTALKGALEPFAEAADLWDVQYYDNQGTRANGPGMEDHRRAYSLLSGQD